MTNAQTRNCPSPQALAAFIDGRSPRPELASIVAHLQGCGRCRALVEMAAEEELESSAEEGAPATDVSHGSRFPWWLSIAAAAAIAVVAVLLWTRRESRTLHDPIEQLAAAAPSSARKIEGRLSGGFRWAPLDSMRGGNSQKTEELLLSGAAGTVLQKVGARSDPEALHAAALAYLLTDQREEAAARLEQATRARPGDPRLWSDLAAVRLENAIRLDSSSELGPALSAANRALELSGTLPEARFNRALILERLGLRDEARRAWSDYLQVDQTGPWADEARDRLRRLGPQADARAERRRVFAAFEAGDAEPLRAFVAANPQEARSYSEGFLSSEWAKADQKGDSAQAAALMAQLRFVAGLLAARGEHLLEDALAAAAATEHDPAARRALTDGYVAYDQGRLRLYNEHPTEAEPFLRKASTLLERAKSPMAADAAYFLANSLFVQTRLAESCSIHESLHASIDRTRYPALNAQILWQLALCNGYEGEWSSCLMRSREAKAIFDRQGEERNGAFTEAIMAEAYDRMAQVEEGWRHRVAALQVLSAHGDRQRIAPVLNGAVRAESYRRRYDSALALAELAIAENSASQEQELLAEALIQRTIVLRDAGLPERAVPALAEARAAVAGMKDERKRALRMTEADVLEASILHASNPGRAIALLDRAIAFYGEHRHAMWLPGALLVRGRAHRAAGDLPKAVADFEAGIREVEQQRSTIGEEKLRSGFFDTVPDLFSEAIASHLALNDVEAAYATMERARARTLYEHLGVSLATTPTVSSAALRGRIDPDSVVIEYQLLHDGIAIFCIDRDSISVTQKQVDSAVLRRVTLDLIDSIRDDRDLDVRRAATEAWRLLIEPVAGRVDGKKRIVFIPDRFLHSITFPVLLDPRSNEYLVQRHEIVIAPSAALSAGMDADRSIATSPALVIGDPAVKDGVDPLPRARDEARAVADLYGATPLIGREASRSAFIARAPQSALIHYAGHGSVATGDVDGHLLLAGSDGDGALTATEIAKLPLSRTLLVSLAACSTLRGSPDRIEGMPSVARAFVAAGVPFVVGTAWDVPDESSADLFRDFHERLRRGSSPPAALREAQLAALHRTSARRRFTWATVEIIGAHLNRRGT